jgi:hypothetical protein
VKTDTKTSSVVAALPQHFRDLAKVLKPLATQGQSAAGASPTATLAARCLDRLERDLLPRTAGAHEHLVAGIVGPNNAGKSLLFNSLVGHKISPSEPRGGATRCLIGATSNELAQMLLAEPSLAQFPLAPVAFDGAPSPVRRAGENAANPAELLLVRLDDFPPGVLLIDAPDFDSFQTANRAASESLLQVADLALVVVTRHTYHNELVVSFLEGWLQHDRPWALVYNEAYADETITAEHAASLAQKLGVAPVAVFLAPFDIKLQEGEGVLEPVAITPSLAPATAIGESHPPAQGTALAEWLFGDERKRLKARALEASSASLRSEAAALVEELNRESELAERLLAAVAEPALAIGRRVAGRSMPPGPFLEAFRRVADRRIAPWRRHLRGGARKLRFAVENISGKLMGSKSSSQESGSVADLEAIELGPEIGPFLEAIAARLQGRSDFWQSVDGSVDAGAERLKLRVAADLVQASAELHNPTKSTAPSVEGDELLITPFVEVCEVLIEAEFDSNGRRTGEHILQFGVDLLHGLPVIAGIGTAIATGGLGADVATVAASGLGVAMTERFSKFLGTNVARSARSRWQDLRGVAIAEALVARALPTLHAELEQQALGRTEATSRITTILDEMP